MNSALLLSALLSFSVPQDQDKPQSQPQAASAELAVKTWLDSDLKDTSKREKAVASLARDGRKGLEMLAKMLPKDPKELAGTENRAKGLHSLLQQYAYAFLVGQVKSNMIFEGQYAPLALLMPHVGIVYIKFVVDTPEWLHESLRRHAVSALRDLYTKEGPAEDAINKLKTIAKDEDFEKEDLRAAVAQALWQWGDKELADKKIATLKKNVESEKADEKLEAQKALADYYYYLRDYMTAAQLWKEWVAGAEKNKQALSPNDYYNVACSISRSGDVDGAIAMLQSCVKAQTEGKTDKSRDVARELFDHDPDLANARKDPRFAELVKACFGEKSEAKKDAKDTSKKNEAGQEKK